MSLMMDDRDLEQAPDDKRPVVVVGVEQSTPCVIVAKSRARLSFPREVSPKAC